MEEQKISACFNTFPCHPQDLGLYQKPSQLSIIEIEKPTVNALYKTIKRLINTYQPFTEAIYVGKIVTICGNCCFPYQRSEEIPFITFCTSSWYRNFTTLRTPQLSTFLKRQ